MRTRQIYAELFCEVTSDEQDSAMTTRCTETRRTKSIARSSSRAADHPPPLEKGARVVNVFLSVGLLILPDPPTCREPRWAKQASRYLRRGGTAVLSPRRRRTTLLLGSCLAPDDDPAGRRRVCLDAPLQVLLSTRRRGSAGDERTTGSRTKRTRTNEEGEGVVTKPRRRKKS